MKTIEQLAREAGFHDFYCGGQDYHTQIIQRFHDAAIAQYRESLLAGVDEPYYPQWSHSNEFAAYTADQLAAAVLRERERIAARMEHLDPAWTAEEIAAAIRGSDD